MEVDSLAPDFSAPDQGGNIHTLKDYQGHWLLLYFYPKDFTSGCTKEACSLRDNFSKLKKLVSVVGVSADSVDSHKKFADKHALPFTLLSDTKREVIRVYGTDDITRPKRSSFLIDPNGKIVKIYEDVKPEKHVEQVLGDLKHLIQ